MAFRLLVALPAAFATLVACGPPTFIDDTNKIDTYLSQGNFAYACAGLLQSDEHVRGYTAERLAAYPAQPEARDCLCNAVYDAEVGSWDPIVVDKLAGSRHDAAAACLAPATTDTRIRDRVALMGALGAILTEPGADALASVARGDADVAVRAAAIEALKPSRDHEQLLRDVLAGDPDPSLRAAAAKALGGRNDATTRNALLAAVSSDADAAVRREALVVFGDATQVEVVRGVCAALLEDPDASVRVAAANALAGTKSRTAAECLAKRLATAEEAGEVREALLEAMKTSPRPEVHKALCTEIGPWLRRYVKDKLAHEVPGYAIIEAQNHNHWEASYDCVTKAAGQGGYSCYARNYLAHWVNDLGGKAKAPWCEGMMRKE